MTTKFRNDEKGYQAWLAENPDRFVLNARSNFGPSYMVLHTARCSTISNYTRMARRGGFTERQYAKVCATNESEVRDWVRTHGRPDGSVDRCSRCM